MLCFPGLSPPVKDDFYHHLSVYLQPCLIFLSWGKNSKELKKHQWMKKGDCLMYQPIRMFLRTNELKIPVNVGNEEITEDTPVKNMAKLREKSERTTKAKLRSTDGVVSSKNEGLKLD